MSTEKFCNAPIDLSIVLETNPKITESQNTDQRRLAAEIIRHLEVSSEAARITINPLSRNKKSFEIPFSNKATENRDDVCERLNTVDPTSIDYRGEQELSKKIFFDKKPNYTFI